jgi:Domain of unknown function (DUF3425)
MPRPIASENVSVLPTPARGTQDRKRVLNVLAQRRYRQRKRERLAALESLASKSTVKSSAGLDCFNVAASTKQARTISSSDESQSPGAATSNTSLSDDKSSYSFDPSFQSFGGGLSLPDIASTTTVSAWEEMTIPNFDLPDAQYEEVIDPNLLCFDSTSPDYNFQEPITTSVWPDTSNFISYTNPVLPNDLELDVPVLKTMRIGLTIIEMLGGLNHMYDLSARWTMEGCDFSRLPPSFQPTPTQLRVPHHPIIDIIPWPSLRTKIILMYAMPPALRPPSVRDPDSIMQIANDIDDPAEGFIVNGPNGMSEDEWEIGEAFLKNYWWAVDRDIIARTNAQRIRRGAPRLRLIQGA